MGENGGILSQRHSVGEVPMPHTAERAAPPARIHTSTRRPRPLPLTPTIKQAMLPAQNVGFVAPMAFISGYMSVDVQASRVSIWKMQRLAAPKLSKDV
jgi:hypothetical protein